MEKNVEDLLQNYQTTSFHLPSPAFSTLSNFVRNLS